MLLNTPCAVTGTGFLISKKIVETEGGWRCHLLSEDTEFTVSEVLKGVKIGYANDAVFYDEQPTELKQSFIQRMRWVRGYYQILAKYGGTLLKRTFKGSFACFDMFMSVAPAILMMVIGLIFNIFALIFAAVIRSPEMPGVLFSLGFTLFNVYWIFFFMGGVTAITERKRIYTSRAKKILYVFTFPLYMLTYLPIAFVAMVKDVKWVPTSHRVVKDVDSIKKDE